MVYPYKIDKTTNQIVYLDEKPKPPHNELFGFESWRQSVWSSNTLKKLGCKLLSSLSYQDLYIEQQDIEDLRLELKLIKSNIVKVSDELALNKTCLKFRIDNALEAIRIAKQVTNGGIYIG